MRVSLDDLTPREIATLMAHYAATRAATPPETTGRLLSLGLLEDRGGRFGITRKGVTLVLRGYAPA